MSGGLGFLPSTVGPIVEGYVTTLGYGELLYVFLFVSPHEIVNPPTRDFIIREMFWELFFMETGIAFPRHPVVFFRHLKVSGKSKGPTPPMPRNFPGN